MIAAKTFRSLAVSTGWPLPADSGGRQRLAALLRALGQRGQLDFIHLRLQDAEPSHVASLDEIHGISSAAVRTLHSRPLPSKLLRWLTCREPLLFCSHDLAEVVDSVHRQSSRYDLLWAYGPVAGQVVHQAAPAKAVVDFPDLPHEVQLDQLQINLPAKHAFLSREKLVRSVAYTDVERWRQFETRVARECAAITVCSEREKQQFCVGSVHVLPNGYAEVTPVGRVDVGPTPRILFAASAIWPPNVEGAKLLVDEIRPHILHRLPKAEILLTGDYNFLSARAGQSGIRSLGYVPDITDALRMADLIVAPLRSGTGTRLKVLEAWAHRIPVVSTTKGAEGLDAEPNVHLLIADTPEAFADACVRALTDFSLRQRLIDEGYRLFLERYSWSRIARRFQEVSDQVF